MNKKILSAILSVICIFFLCSCGVKYGELDTSITDGLQLAEEYEGKEFVANGIGEVEYVAGVDGDTTTFRSNSVSFKLRYYLINTPESTGKIEAWGKAASKFTTGILDSAVKNGGKIVLQCDSRSDRQDSNARYLGYVWYQPSAGEDFRLLNLEIVEQAYSKFFPSASEYDTEFQAAQDKAKATNRRVWGEPDSGYSYNKLATEITISELYDNQSAYVDTSVKITIEAQITRIVGENLYIRDIAPSVDKDGNDYYAAVYVFSGYEYKPSSLFKIGDIVKFTCKPGLYNDNLQLSDVDFRSENYEITGHSEVEPIAITSGDQIKDSLCAQIVTANLIVEEVYQSANASDNSYTIYCHLEDGTELNVRVNNNGYVMKNFVKDEIWTFTGGLTRYYENYQIELGNYKLTKDAVYVSKN